MCKIRRNVKEVINISQDSFSTWLYVNDLILIESHVTSQSMQKKTVCHTVLTRALP